jgi:signal transduction histidine kinase
MNAPVPPGSNSTAPSPWRARWQSFSATALRWFHVYANWLVGISWKRFFVLSLLLVITAAILHDLPPFTWRITQTLDPAPRVVLPPRPPRAPVEPVEPAKAAKAAKATEPPIQPAKEGSGPGVHIDIPPGMKPGDGSGVNISIGKDGVRITAKPAMEAASVAQAAASDAARAADTIASAAESLQKILPSAVDAGVFREAIDEARREMADAVREAKRDAEQAARDAEQARRDAQQVIEDITQELRGPRTRTTRVGPGDLMMNLSLLWVLASLILKITYKGRVQAEVKAAQATETAEAESLKRQVVEARMAAMQAQVEPHFLFNTLASIDHLIETDPPRASQMQKNLIALLRASMPTMREANGQSGVNGGTQGVRDLGRELAVIRPYLEILKVRMEERLTTQVNVPDGLLSAEFPPMMLQTLVENAIKHGLEPKAEGGSLRVAAEVMHGKLAVSVTDTGLGFGRAATAGTGVGLANIRERLQLLYGARASLTVAANQPSGTLVTISVPYKPVEGVGG